MAASGHFERIAGLDVEIDGVERHQIAVPTATWHRISTVVTLTGAGRTGLGEDVSYDPADQHAHMTTPLPPLSGRRSLGEWSELLDTLELTPQPTSHPESRDYRRWAYESALFDLALRQHGRSLADALARPARPIRFCVSPPGDLAPLRAVFADQEVKINADASWTPDDMARVAAMGGIEVVDMKAHYTGDWIRHPEDPRTFTEAVAAAFPTAVIEDPAIGPHMVEFLDRCAERISFDAPVHSLGDLNRLPRSGWCNIKPSRFGTLPRLLECIDHCEHTGVGMYGGGQFEIGPGRAQIQALASVFYPDGPNDVAPGGYNAAIPDPGLPRSPLPATDGVGFAPDVVAAA